MPSAKPQPDACARPSAKPQPSTLARPAALEHLGRADPVLARLIEHVGPCTLTSDPDLFAVLTRGIVFQLISVKAARTIADRLAAVCQPLTPARLLELPVATLRQVGLSQRKVDYLCGIAQRLTEGQLSAEALRGLSDDQVAAVLRPCPGIGPWTIDMVLIFHLGRQDILPVGDMGLRLAAQTQFGLAQLPSPAELIELARPWQPYRTIATWYLWRSRGFVPQSGE
jgi:DNA-3-methyladenine glycosylase II